MKQPVRFLLIGVGIGAAVLALGFLLQQDWALNVFPWRITRLSAIFIAASILAASVPMLWIGLTQQFAALAGGALDVGVMFLGMAVFTFQLYLQDSSRQAILMFAMAAAVYSGICVVLFLWSRRIPFESSQGIPRTVRISFGIFAIALLLVGGAMIFKVPNIFPWELSVELSVIYGWYFLGAALYFLYGLLRPSWRNSQGQLLGFLAYDLVLVIPFLQHFATVPEHLRLSLIIYMVIITYSGILAIYYLLLNKGTRLMFRS